MWKYCNITLWSLCPISFLPVDKFKETRVIPKVLDVTDIWRKSAAIFFALKLVSAIFYQFFIFSPNDSPSKTEKCFLFHLKSSFHSRDIQTFVFSPLLFHLFQIQKDKQRIIQKKSASSSWMLPCLVIFFWNLILIWKLPKMVFK